MLCLAHSLGIIENFEMRTLKNLLSPARSMPQWNESRRGKLKPHDAEPVGLSKTNNPGPVVHPYLVAPWKRNRAQSEHLKKSIILKDKMLKSCAQQAAMHKDRERSGPQSCVWPIVWPTIFRAFLSAFIGFYRLYQ